MAFDFEAVIDAQLTGQTVRAELLVAFHFLSGTTRVWNGFGRLPTLDPDGGPGSVEWLGLLGLGGITGLKQPLNGTAPETTLTLSGVDPTFAAKAKAEANEYFLRPVKIHLVFFDEDWQPISRPRLFLWARMHTLVPKREPNDGGGSVRSVTITAESPFSGRRRPRHGFLTDNDQQLRYPGDRGAERVAGIEAKNITFPDA